MVNLEDFEFKNVEITFKNEKKYKGIAKYFSSALDNDDYIAEDSISVFPDKDSKSGIEVFQSEIKSIKIID